MTVFSKFQLCDLKTLNSSSHYHFLWFCRPFTPFFWKNGKKSEFGRFWPIFRKMALDMPKWLSETLRIDQMASFRMVFDPVTYGRIFGKVYREPSNFCRHALLKNKKILWLIWNSHVWNFTSNFWPPLRRKKSQN